MWGGARCAALCAHKGCAWESCCVCLRWCFYVVCVCVQKGGRGTGLRVLEGGGKECEGQGKSAHGAPTRPEDSAQNKKEETAASVRCTLPCCAAADHCRRC